MASQNEMKLIVGQHGGVKVYCSSIAYPIYEQLALQGRGKNHWAGLIVRGLRGLSNGIINSDDVFVSDQIMHQGVQDFLINLPGCKVYAQRRDNGSYVISKIVPEAGDYQGAARRR